MPPSPGDLPDRGLHGPDGLRRYKEIAGDNIYWYAYDGQSMVREYLYGSVNATYLTGPRGPEYRRDASGNVKWYVYDGLGSVIGEINPSGTLTSARAYDVYGAVRRSAGTASSKHGYVGGLGHTTDDETGGLVYMRARYMDPQVGRFISEDTAGDGANWFVYCNNDPVNMGDATGQNASCIRAIVNFVAGMLGIVLPPSVISKIVSAYCMANITKVLIQEALRTLAAGEAASAAEGPLNRMAYVTQFGIALTLPLFGALGVFLTTREIAGAMAILTGDDPENWDAKNMFR